MTPENLTRLRELASAARIEWRVADPATKSYCATFDRSDTLTPEEDAHAWLEDHRKRFPGGRFADYEVICVEVRTELQRLAGELLAKAERLNTPGDPDLLAQLHAQCKHLLDDLTVTTHDEHGLAEHSPVASLTHSNFIGALVPLVSRAGAALAEPKCMAATANAIWDPKSPVEPNALESSITVLEAWDARADGDYLTQSEGESVALVLHELKRLRAASQPPHPARAKSNAAPQRACRLILEMQADTPGELASALHNFAHLIDRGEVSTGVSGGPSSGAIYELHLGTEPSHNEYFNRVATYLRRLQEEKDSSNGL